MGNEYKGLKGNYNLGSTGFTKVRISHPCDTFRSRMIVEKC